MSKKNSEIHINRARASLSQVLSWYGQTKNHPPEIQAKLRSDLDLLKNCLHKLDQEIIYIAVFGLVSRGKSAVLNALMGEKVLQTGPLNGVTQWAKSIRWNISSLDPDQESKIIELIDTPGLDEINGEIRGQMAKDVANQADLILFVVSGDITRTEYEAICELKKSQKPLILVFNKIDLYPDQDRQSIYKQLQDLGAKRRLISINDIVMVSAEPAPIQVRVESADNNISYEWEKPLPQIDELREKILTLLQKEGLSLLALNALVQARDIEENIAEKILELRQKEAEKLIWRFVQYKSVAVAVNPIGLIDVMGGIITDLMLIRALSKLYNLPMTGYEAGKLW
ncbi:MAG TPA: GTP-binding protein, partial [Allocoleopsis sp.]